MSSKPVLYKILATIVLVTLMAGCSSPTAQPTATTAAPIATFPATITDTPTTAPTDTNTPAPATDTPAATDTFTPAPTDTTAPTLTPIPPTAFPTATFNPATLTPTSGPGYACFVTSTTPKSTDTVKVSTEFDWTWVIRNTGAKLWGKSAADLKYLSGQSMQTGASVYDLTKDVPPGSDYTATIHMKTPSTAATYTASWQIIQDSVLVCSLTVSVKVVN